MSRIYFHAKDGGSEVRGSERAHAGCLSNDIGIGLLLARCRWGTELARVCAALSDGRYPVRDEQSLRLMLSVDAAEAVFKLADGTTAQAWLVILNTCLRVGSRPVRLLTRLHAQCEIHAWVDGPNRGWLAEIIEEGRRDGLMRADSGWESTIEMLRGGEGPVVTSYSVTDQFPNAHIADWEPPVGEDDDEDEPNWDGWCDLPNDERWDLSMAALRAKDTGLELRPEDFDTFHFGVGITAFDLLDRLPKEPA